MSNTTYFARACSRKPLLFSRVLQYVKVGISETRVTGLHAAIQEFVVAMYLCSSNRLYVPHIMCHIASESLNINIFCDRCRFWTLLVIKAIFNDLLKQDDVIARLKIELLTVLLYTLGI